MGNIEQYLNKVICGDSAKVLKKFSDNCIDLTITSPPYGNIRKDAYNSVFDFQTIAKELYRVTRPGGIVVWIIGDETKNGSESLESFKQALFFKEKCGFLAHDTMIYAKNNPVPLTHNRYEQQFEYMFVLSKGKPKTFNPIMRDTINGGKERSKGRIRQTGNELLPKHTPGIIDKQSIDYNIWFFNVGYGQTSKDNRVFNHPAAFPEELARKHILSWTNENDLVLDCFSGSGTSLVVAKQLNRNYVGIEIDERYCKLSIERLNVGS